MDEGGKMCTKVHLEILNGGNHRGCVGVHKQIIFKELYGVCQLV
jgi:hypothetical protein